MSAAALIIRLDRDLHARFKSQCALRGESMNTVLKRAVEKYTGTATVEKYTGTTTDAPANKRKDPA